MRSGFDFGRAAEANAGLAARERAARDADARAQAQRTAGAQRLAADESALRGHAAGLMGQALSGNAPSVAAAQLADQIARTRGAQARLSLASPAARAAAASGMGSQAVGQAVAPAMAASGEQWGQAGRAAGIYGGLGQQALQLGQQNAELHAARVRAAAAKDQAGWDIFGKVLGGLAMGGAAVAVSDERAKSAIAPADAEADAALAALRPVRFAYRGEAEDEPAHLGVIAQDVERGGPMGQAMVERDEDGMRMLVGDRVMPAVFDMLDRLNQRIDAVANGKRGNRGGLGQPPPPPLPVPPPRPMEG